MSRRSLRFLAGCLIFDAAIVAAHVVIVKRPWARPQPQPYVEH